MVQHLNSRGQGHTGHLDNLMLALLEMLGADVVERGATKTITQNLF